MSVTIKDVARESGVSVSTVSKVMNDSSEIPKSTADKVKATIEKLNYVPNRNARLLGKRQTKNIMFVAKFEKDSAFTNPHMFEIMSGAQFYLNKKGYTFSLMNVEDDSLTELNAMIDSKVIDGVILHASIVTPKTAKLIESKDFPHVVVGNLTFRNNLCTIDTNNYLAGELAGKHLLKIGREKIAFIGGETEDCICEARWKGVSEFLENANAPILPAFHLRGQSTKEDGEYMTGKLLKGNNIPDGIICANNNIALGCMTKLNELQKKVPEEIAVISFDKFPYSTMTTPHLTVVHIDVYELGVQSAKMLLSKIKNNDLHLQSFSTVPTLVVRKSTRIE